MCRNLMMSSWVGDTKSPYPTCTRLQLQIRRTNNQLYHGDDRFDPTSEESDDTDDDFVLHDRNPLSDDGSNPSDVIE